MPLLEVDLTDLQMLREAVDAKVKLLAVHAQGTDDAYLRAALDAEMVRYINLRQSIVHAGRPAPSPDGVRAAFVDRWEAQKAEYDRQQDADIRGGLVL